MRTRLLAGTAIGVSLAFAVGAIFIYALTRSQLYDTFDDALGARAHALSALIEQEGHSIETDLGREELATEFHQVWTTEGVSLRRSASLGTRDLARFSTTTTGMTIDAVTLPDGRAGRQATFVFQPHQDTEEHAPAPQVTLVLAVARDTEQLDATIARLGRVLIVVGFAMTLACVALLAAIVRFGLRPVHELAAAIAKLDLAGRLDTARTPGELRPVVERLNELLRRLEGAFARERELTAEVAHELRTPMAGLRATIELALDRERTPERYRTALADCLAICVQTERTVESLLSLARLDAGMVAASRAPVAVDELVREVLASYAARAGERGLSVETELAAVTLASDRDKLRIVIHNLVDNAVSYANAGGTVRVVVEGERIVVANTGCALAPEQVARVFERFWRADPARSSGHVGVGLALCKKLIELLGGSLAAEAKDGRFVATIRLESRTSKVDVDRSPTTT